MDKHVNVNVKMKRPRILSLCMAATAASVLLLAGCGDNGDEEMPPAQQPESMEQGANTSLETEGTVTQEPADMSSTGQADSTANDAPVPQESIQPEDEARTNTVDEEPGFGEGTDPMPGANEENDDELTSGQ